MARKRSITNDIMAKVQAPRGGKRSRQRRNGSMMNMGNGSRRRSDYSKYVTPGAAMVAVGALAAAGYALREKLGDLMVDGLEGALKQASKAAVTTSKMAGAARDQAKDALETLGDKVSVDSLLALAGLKRKSMAGAILGPSLGVLCGFVAGAACTYMFGPKVLEAIRGMEESASKAEEGSMAEHEMGNDVIRSNSGTSRPMS